MKNLWRRRKAMSINTRKYIENYLKIQNKRSEIIPFEMNRPQIKLYEALAKQYKKGKPQRAIILKARQMGFSTLTEALIFKKTVTHKNIKSGIVTHEAQATTNLFNISKRYLNGLPEQLRPSIKNSNAKELIFDNEAGTGLNSSIKCMTAGNNSIGRSDTFQNLHISEYAFWEGDKEKTLAGLLQAVPYNLNTIIIIESTANGFENFKELWDKAVAGNSDFVPVFCAWWELEEYRLPYNGFALTEEEESLKMAFRLDNEQLAWRRWCIANNCQGNIGTFHQEYPSYPEEAFVSSGNCVFDTNNIIKRLGEVKEPIKQGSFLFDYDGLKISNIRWIDDKNGLIKIYEDVKPKYPYVIGGDTAGEGSDNFTGHVLDNTNGKQVAVLENNLDEDIYARQIYCLGMYYNTALLGIEVNFSTFPLKELERIKYPNLYIRKQEDSYMHGYEKKYGFKTTSVTRPIIIAQLVEIAREEINLINDKNTLREMLTFVKNEKGRPEAMRGSHDDHVMGLAIAYYIRPQQKMIAPQKSNMAKIKWTDDMYEDYRNASDDIRKMMELQFGLPN
jgi:hypothetical protein